MCFTLGIGVNAFMRGDDLMILIIVHSKKIKEFKITLSPACIGLLS